MFGFSLLSQQLTFFYGVHTVGVAVVLQMILLPRGESGCWDIARGRHSLCSHHHLCHHHLCHHHIHHLHHNHQYYRHYHCHDLLARGKGVVLVMLPEVDIVCNLIIIIVIVLSSAPLRHRQYYHQHYYRNDLANGARGEVAFANADVLF